LLRLARTNQKHQGTQGPSAQRVDAVCCNRHVSVRSSHHAALWGVGFSCLTDFEQHTGQAVLHVAGACAGDEAIPSRSSKNCGCVQEMENAEVPRQNPEIVATSGGTALV